MPCFIYDMYPAEERSENENGIVPGKEAMPFAKRVSASDHARMCGAFF